VLVRAVLLDVDDTLVDTRGAFRHALVQIAGEYLRRGVDPEEVTAFWRADRHDWYRAHTRGELTHREQRMRRAQDLHAHYGGPDLDQDSYDVWDAAFEQHFCDGWRAHDDAAPLLDALDAAGIPYGGVSNAGFDYQELKLAACGLERVPMLVGVDTFGVGKPDPRVFVEGARRIGRAVGECAYIGDEYDIDAIAAHEAGMAGVWIDRPGARRSSVPEDAADDARITRVTSLAEVPTAVRLG